MKMLRFSCKPFVDPAAGAAGRPLRIRLAGRPSALPAAAFGGFVLWLLALPMEGFLLPSHAAPWLPFFLAPHVLSLLLCSQLSARQVAAWSRLGAPLAVAASLAAATLPPAAPAALVGAGLGAGPVLIRLGLLLGTPPRPHFAAAAGLAAGNGLLLLLLFSGLPRGISLVIVLAALSGAAGAGLSPPGRDASPEAEPGPLRLRHFLPFVLVFHVVSGLFYGVLVPAYGGLDLPRGLELPFYVGCVFASVRLVRVRTELVPSLAVLLALGSFGLYSLGAPWAVAVSMFAMQGSAGFMDSFVLFLLLGQQRRIRAFGLGLGTVCLGILGGSLLGTHVGDGPRVVAALGNGALALAVLTLYLWAHRTAPRPPSPVPGEPAAAPEPPPPPAASLAAPPPFLVPPGLRARLSPAERSVLELVVGGKLFREAAEVLEVSESTVKTHMKRVYEKAGVTGKKALLEKLARRAAREGDPAPGAGPGSQR